MKDQNRTRQELMEEVKQLNKRVAELKETSIDVEGISNSDVTDRSRSQTGLSGSEKNLRYLFRDLL